MLVLPWCAVAPELTDARRERFVVRHDHPSVAEAAEILAREEGERGRAADGADAPTVPAPRADGLRPVFQQRGRRGGTGALEGSRASGAPEQMDDDRGLDGATNPFRGEIRVEIERIGVDVREHRPRADA